MTAVAADALSNARREKLIWFSPSEVLFFYEQAPYEPDAVRSSSCVGLLQCLRMAAISTFRASTDGWGAALLTWPHAVGPRPISSQEGQAGLRQFRASFM